jgi:hypothetical protein
MKRAKNVSAQSIRNEDSKKNILTRKRRYEQEKAGVYNNHEHKGHIIKERCKI